MTTGTPGFASANSHSQLILRRFWLFVAILLFIRLVIGGMLVLVPDEAVYWSWSRHLSLGYLDHPPLIAWLNWLSTRVLGSTELAVRLPMAILAYASVAVIVLPIGRLAFPDARAQALLALMWLTSPMLFGFATISTPDTPVFFFQTCALACVLRIAWMEDSPTAFPDELERSAGTLREWLLFGVFTGLAMLSKYTAVLLPGAVVGWLITSRSGRVHLTRPGIYLAALTALLIFSPVIYWNATHEWASFAFQLHHGMSGETDLAAAPHAPATTFFAALLTHLVYAGGFLGGQAALWTPVLFVLGLVALICSWSRFSGLGAIDRLLLWAATVPLALFFVAWVKKPGEINWPSFAYVPLSILMIRQVRENGSGAWTHWIRAGINVAIAFSIGLHLLLLPQAPAFLAKLHLKTPHNVSDLHAPWKKLGAMIGAQAGGKLIVCNRHQDAGEVAFYVPGQPNVWCDGVGSRVTAFDFFPNPPDFHQLGHVFFVGGHAHEFAAKYQYNSSTARVLKVGSGASMLSRQVTDFSRNDAVGTGSVSKP